MYRSVNRNGSKKNSARSIRASMAPAIESLEGRKLYSATVTPRLGILGATKVEGDSGTSVMSFRVYVFPAATADVTATYTTEDGTAVAGSDYVAQTGTITVYPGVESKISIVIKGDTSPELDEHFVIKLSNVKGAGTEGTVAWGDIANDDAPKVPFKPGPSISTGGSIITSADLNGDGKTDLIVGDGGTVLLNKGGGAFAPAAPLKMPFTPIAITIADVNGDKKLDIIGAGSTYGLAANDQAFVLLGDGAGGFAAPLSYDVGQYPQAVTTGDFNGDKKLDIATANDSGGVNILYGNGNGTFKSAILVATNKQMRSIVSADFNHDGFDDIAAGNVWDGNIVLIPGGATAAVSTTLTGVGFPGTMLVRDINRDTKPDLVVVDEGIPGVATFLGKGDGSFSDVKTSAFCESPAGGSLADFNGDGILDIAMSRDFYTSDYMTVAIGKGDGTFSDPVAFGTGAEPRDVTTGDFDQDGDQDIAVIVPDSGQVKLFLNPSSTAHVNQPPIAASDAATTTKNTPIAINVLANDKDTDGKLVPASVAAVTSPAHGVVSLNATTGALTYTPAAGFTGSDSFTYTVKDDAGALSNAATVTLNVKDATSPSITFTLINADTDKDITALVDGSTLDLAKLPTHLAVRASSSSPAGSVRFGFDQIAGAFVSSYHVETLAPYALFGDDSGNYRPGAITPGHHTLTATPFSSGGATGIAGVSSTIHLNVIGQPTISAFVLIDADTNKDIRVLKDGDTLTLASLPAHLAIRADTLGTVGSVQFGYDLNLGAFNSSFRIESTAPYALFGDAPVGDYLGFTPIKGEHTLSATAFTAAGAKGTAGPAMTIHFEVK